MQQKYAALHYQDYIYLYETHLHTSQASACAQNTGYEMAQAAHEYGYAGMIVTEHNWGGNTCIPNDLPWEAWVDAFTKGYESACEYGKTHDFDVFFGYEAGYHGTEFLIYGVSPDWMKAHPEIKNATIEEQYQLIREAGGMVVHAHPFREEWYIPEILLYPDFVDAVEGINATHSCKRSVSHNNPEYDKKATRYANAHGLPITAGSDMHTTGMFGGGVLFKKRIQSIGEYRSMILSGDYVLTNGDTVFNRFGEALT